MIRTVTATTAKAQILALLDDVAAGEEIEITKDDALRGQAHSVAVW